MNKFSFIAVQPLAGGNWKINHLEVLSESDDLSTVIMSYVEECAQELGDSYFMTVDSYAPITFDCTMSLISDDSKTYPSDRFETTYNKWYSMVNEATKKINFDKLTKTFCRIHTSDSGKAGEYFTFHDADFGRFRKDPKAPFSEHGIFNEPTFYFKK